MHEPIFIPTLNGRGVLLPKQREIVLSELTTPRFHKLPKFQRGSIGIFTGGLIIEEAGGGGVTPLVSNIEIIQSVSSGASNAGILFNYTLGGFANHQLVQRHSTLYTLLGFDQQGSPVDHTGEWTAAAVVGADWEVACTSEDSGTWDFPHATVGTYTTFATANMQWREHRVGAKGYTPGTDTCTATFRIREVADPGGNFDDFQVIATAIQT